MKEITVLGRGGQGAVTAAYLLAVAGFEDGKYTQAFPTFGVERRGAPVKAFVRLDNKFIRTRAQVYKSDVMLVLDPTLIEVIDIKSSIKKGGCVIINSNKKAHEFDLEGFRVHTVDATSAAFDILGRDIVNTAMLGAFAAFTGEISKQAILNAIDDQFSGTLAEKNKKLVEVVFEKAKGGE